MSEVVFNKKAGAPSLPIGVFFVLPMFSPSFLRRFAGFPIGPDFLPRDVCHAVFFSDVDLDVCMLTFFYG